MYTIKLNGKRIITVDTFEEADKVVRDMCYVDGLNYKGTIEFGEDEIEHIFEF